jgi:hypothetical protein
VYTTAFAVIEAWRARLAGQEAFSASEVQDRLFDLYGELDGRPPVELIKPWLTLTVHRELFGARELEAMLDELTTALDIESSQSPDQRVGQVELAELTTELSEPVA